MWGTGFAPLGLGEKMKKLLVLLAGTVLSLSAFAAQYPVDQDIADLRAKADYLEALKNTVEKNRCTVQVGTNRVALSAGALRSNGLVMAIADGMPGNYLAYHQAPKPEFLSNVINFTVGHAGASKGAAIVTAQLGYAAGGGAAKGVLVTINEPEEVQGADGLFIYQKAFLKLAFNDQGKLGGKITGKAVHGRDLVLDCE